MATQYLTHYFYHLSINASPSHQLPPLALMCFYMAVKVHESAVIPLSRLTELYQRFFFAQDKNNIHDVAGMNKQGHWEKLELDVCHVLNWRLHPPTALKKQQQEQSSESVLISKQIQTVLEHAFL